MASADPRQRCMVVEDDPTSRELIAAIARSCALEVITVDDGQRAWDLLLQSPTYELLVTDMILPGMLGQQLVEQVRARAEFDGLPIIMVSGVLSTRDIKGLLDQGVHRFMAKPINPTLLRQYICALTAPPGHDLD